MQPDTSGARKSGSAIDLDRRRALNPEETLIGKGFIDPDNDIRYHVTGVLPAFNDILAGAAALVILRDGHEARLLSAFQADRIENELAFYLDVIVRAGPYRYPAGTPFVLYRVASWKNGKVWATPLSHFHKQFKPIEDAFNEDTSTVDN